MRKGFSLLELAVVIIIIGLIAGGIILGQNIVRASELQTVSVDVDRFRTAATSFRYKYLALPGDMPNATGLWGAVDADNYTCGTLPSTDTKTCNGNGDGKIWYPYTDPSMGREFFHAWKQLSNAGMVDGKYTGISYSYSVSSVHFKPFVNTPGSTIDGGVFAMLFIDVADPYGSTTQMRVFQTKGQHYIILGAEPEDPLEAALPREKLLSTEEAFSLDTKNDDGFPDTGKVMTLTHDSANNEFAYQCIYDSDLGPGQTWQYDSSLSGRQCVMVFETGF